MPMSLPSSLTAWFDAQGWTLHPHQLAMLDRAHDPATLLIAPTGGGKTLAGFLTTLAELGPTPAPGLHTLYISPLKALAAQTEKKIEKAIKEIGEHKIDVKVQGKSATFTLVVKAK